MSCQIYLINHTPNPDRTVAAAAKLCYSDSTVAQLMDDRESENAGRFIGHLLNSGHLSPFEHVSFTFGMDGISRICTHQLVRHRMASYSQQSQRYVSMDSPQFVIPHTIESNPEIKRSFDEYSRKAHQLYLEMIEKGIPKEDARYILPHGWETRITVTMNARELHHFFSLRTCRRSQWEIQEVGVQMLRLVRKVAPCIFEKAGPSCVVDGECREMKPCGRPFASVEELLNQ